MPRSSTWSFSIRLATKTLCLRRNAVGWGTELQDGRWWVRFPMVSLEFFVDIFLPAALWPWGWLSLQQKWVPGVFPEGKVGRCVGLTSFPPSCADCLVLWEPQLLGTLRACSGIPLLLQWRKRTERAVYFVGYVVMSRRILKMKVADSSKPFVEIMCVEVSPRRQFTLISLSLCILKQAKLCAHATLTERPWGQACIQGGSNMTGTDFFL